MNDNEKVLTSGLRALAAAETRTPPPELEQQLLQRLQPHRTRRAPVYLGMAASVAAGIVAVAVLRTAHVGPPPIQMQQTAALTNPHKSIPEPRKIALTADTPPRRVRARPRRPILRALQESETVPLMRIPFSEALQPTDRAELVRVSIPAAQLISWGFPISGTDPNYRVNADVLVGGDGLARAVRLIRTGAKP